MSVPREYGQGTLFDAPLLLDRLFGKTDRYRLFRARVMPVLRGMREELAKLYCDDNGRPAIEPVTIAGVTVLQYMENTPDRQVAEAARLHLGWKYALDLPLDYSGFHATSLVVFRERLLEAKLEGLLFDKVLETLQAAGLVRRRNKQRIDSTHIVGNVAKLSRLELVRETIRLAVELAEKSGMQPPSMAELVERYCEADVDIVRRVAVCPAGRLSTEFGKISDASQGSTCYRIQWGSQCDTCDLQPRCTTSKEGRRVLSVSLRHDLVQARRIEMLTPAFKERMKQRNAMEGTVSELVRNGMRRTRYRGLKKTNLANLLYGAACNVRRWLRLTQPRWGCREIPL